MINKIIKDNLELNPFVKFIQSPSSNIQIYGFDDIRTISVNADNIFLPDLVTIDSFKFIKDDKNKTFMFCFYEDKDGEIINTVQTAVVYCPITFEPREKVVAKISMGKIQLTSDEIETIIIKNSHIDRDFRLRYFNLLDYTETDGFIGGHTYSKFKTTPNHLNSEKTDILQSLYHRLGIPTKKVLDRWLHKLDNLNKITISIDNEDEYLLLLLN